MALKYKIQGPLIAREWPGEFSDYVVILDLIEFDPKDPLIPLVAKVDANAGVGLKLHCCPSRTRYLIAEEELSALMIGMATKWCEHSRVTKTILDQLTFVFTDHTLPPPFLTCERDGMQFIVDPITGVVWKTSATSTDVECITTAPEDIPFSARLNKRALSYRTEYCHRKDTI